MFQAVVNIQSIGLAIQDMLLTALDLGLAWLWICVAFEAYDELCQWLGEPVHRVAAVLFGYPDESPNARSRKAVGDVTRWM